jgi:glutamine amidotransferase
MIGVIDYGVGNTSSVLGALAAIGAPSKIVSCSEELGKYRSCILPGVGSFATCMKSLEQGGWVTAIRKHALGEGKPLLGICLGMQILAYTGVEGSVDGEFTNGLGLIRGNVVSLRDHSCNLRIPHVGWNDVKIYDERNAITVGIESGSDFYFVHSYAFTDIDPGLVLGTVHYGVDIPVIVRSGNVWGTQFHPEKSSKAGLRLLHNFAETM